MYTAMTIALVVSWLFLFFGIFLFERMEQRLTTLTVQQQHTIRLQQAILDHLNIEMPTTELTDELAALVQDGKTYEAIHAYRSIQGVSQREARTYIQHLSTEIPPAPAAEDHSDSDEG